MNIIDFFDNVENNKKLRGVGIDDTGDQPLIVVECVMSRLCTKMSLQSIIDNVWVDIEPVLLCEREPIALTHMTRVVGYYSRIDNWNKSKLGELTDRQNGNYEVK